MREGRLEERKGGREEQGERGGGTEGRVREECWTIRKNGGREWAGYKLGQILVPEVCREDLVECRDCLASEGLVCYSGFDC